MFASTDWDNYRTLSDITFADDRFLHDGLIKTSLTQQDVDFLWKSITFNISETAKKTIPHKQIPYRNPKKPTKLLDLRPIGLLAYHVTLRKIVSAIKYNPDLTYFSQLEIRDYNNKINFINTEMDLSIPSISPDNLSNWLLHEKSNLKLIKKTIKLETLKAKEKAISKRLIQCTEDTITNQSRMLSSVLDKDFRRIVIDRIVTTDSNRISTLHTNPDNILKLAATQYKFTFTTLSR